VVVIESLSEGEPESISPPRETSGAVAENRSRLELLEARVEALEATLRDAMAAGRAAPAGPAPRKLVWVTATPGQPPLFSQEQGQALFHNLGGVRSQAITIRTPAGDAAAHAHGEWFKSIFERAGWIAHGPEEFFPDTPILGLCLAVPELPVAKDAAETYLALKAAGFEPIPVLDSAPRRPSGDEGPALALTLPPEKAA
jgi:hypothetical protein